ncbi:hypothetical protein BKA56DRAFT_594415 [Ilyonectria sp. MPI-CAGE-AT-0026]|nr:hypothetical protein BKA56DRAFT_594415 [Ilyonectria sp. MPI-CAGE-AT-0026]
MAIAAVAIILFIVTSVITNALLGAFPVCRSYLSFIKICCITAVNNILWGATRLGAFPAVGAIRSSATADDSFQHMYKLKSSSQI